MNRQYNYVINARFGWRDAGNNVKSARQYGRVFWWIAANDCLHMYNRFGWRFFTFINHFNMTGHNLHFRCDGLGCIIGIQWDRIGRYDTNNTRQLFRWLSHRFCRLNFRLRCDFSDGFCLNHRRRLWWSFCIRNSPRCFCSKEQFKFISIDWLPKNRRNEEENVQRIKAKQNSEAKVKQNKGNNNINIKNNNTRKKLSQS